MELTTAAGQAAPGTRPGWLAELLSISTWEGYLRKERAERRLWPLLLGLIVGGSALYGAVLGSWHGARLAAYDAVKLPLLLLLTSALTMPFNWVAGRILGIPLRPSDAWRLAFLCLAVAALVLAALTPVAALFTCTAPPPTPEARTAHNLLYLLHTSLVGAGGLAGMRVLWRVLAAAAPHPAAARRVGAAWLLAFAFVGGEVAWSLRPFVGSVYAPVAFLRPDPLDGNVYEFIATDILPHLLGAAR